MPSTFRFLAPLALAALVVSACGGESPAGDAGATQAPATAAQNTVDDTAGTASQTDPDTSPPAEADAQPSGPDGEPAPDFTLALADGTSFSPSAEARPVYMVFWAEW